MSKIYDEIQQLGSNKEKIQFMVSNGLNPFYGLPADLTMLMVDIYVEVSGDGSMRHKYSCGGCLTTIWRKLNDFINYGDNVGAPLINWEPVEENNIEEEDDNQED